MMRIKRNDTVLVLTGKDKGKRGTVVEVDTSKGRIKVTGIAVITKHYKARRQGEQSAIKKQEGFIDISNVMLIAPADSKPTRVGFEVQDNGTKTRVARRTKTAL